MNRNVHTGAGFTLVEIMVVVVIIGILSAMAIPIAKRVRNSAIEKTLLNDAKEISSAFSRRLAETSATHATLGDLIGSEKYVSGLSSGTVVLQSSGPVNFATVSAAGLWSLPAGMSVRLATDSDSQPEDAVFRLGNPAYDTALSSMRQVIDPTQGGYNADPTTTTTKDCALVFAVETGALLKKTATSPDQTAAYGH